MIKIQTAKGIRQLICKNADCNSSEIDLVTSREIPMPPGGKFQLTIIYDCSKCGSRDKYALTNAKLFSPDTTT